MSLLRIHLLYQITQGTADLLSLSLFLIDLLDYCKDQWFVPISFVSIHALALARQNDVRIHAYLFISFVHWCIVFNALLPTLYNSLFICIGTQVFPMLDGHTPIYGSPFNLIAFDLWTFPIDSYVQIVSKYGLLSCSFSDILTLVDFMQMNVHPRSFWLDSLSCPLDSLVLDIQLTLC